MNNDIPDEMIFQVLGAHVFAVEHLAELLANCSSFTTEEVAALGYATGMTRARYSTPSELQAAVERALAAIRPEKYQGGERWRKQLTWRLSISFPSIGI